MPRSRSQSFFSPGMPTWRRWAIVGLGLFVLLDAALIVYAIVATTRPATQHHPAAVLDTPTSTPSSTPTPVTTPTAPPAAAAPPSRIIVAVDGTTAWRATVGSCPAAKAAPELTTDGGATWKKTDAYARVGASAIVSMDAVSQDQMSMVTLAASGCTPQFVGTFVGGNDWATYPDRLATAWYINPADRATVNGPQGAHPAPCSSVVALSARDTNSAAVLCSDHSLYRTTDGGASWGTKIDVPGAVNLADTGSGYVVAVIGNASCAGVGILTLADSAPPPSLSGPLTGCYATPSTPAPGNVAISGAANTLWIWVDDLLARSADGGKKW